MVTLLQNTNNKQKQTSFSCLVCDLERQKKGQNAAAISHTQEKIKSEKILESKELSCLEITS